MCYIEEKAVLFHLTPESDRESILDPGASGNTTRLSWLREHEGRLKEIGDVRTVKEIDSV